MTTTTITSALDLVTPAMVAEVREICEAAEQRRSKARYNTGTISLAAAVYLRAWCQRVLPKVAVEIGTFIGTSTFAIQAETIYTCDKDNDCVESTERIVCHPFHTSTDMLGALVVRCALVDFFFFDGRIQMEDLPLIVALSRKRTVYAFDDYEGGEKGVVNVRRLNPQIPHHRLIRPPKSVPGCEGTTTIAVLAPKEFA